MADFDLIMADYNAHLRDIVEFQTWGHLAPKAQTKYTGWILFAVTPFGGGTNTLLIDFEFDGLDSSPWLYEDVNYYLDNFDCKDNEGKVFKFIGTYKRFKNDNHKFWGKSIEIKTNV